MRLLVEVQMLIVKDQNGMVVEFLADAISFVRSE
jgi:hypothetical protein